MTPPDFYKVIKDFVKDIVITYPEIKLNNDLQTIHDAPEDGPKESFDLIFEYMLKIIPGFFFDILYEKETLFDDSRFFLPDIDFKLLWNENITERTKTIIWKYLKLVLLIIVGHMNVGEQFGDTAKLFETLNEHDLKQRLNDAVKDIHSFFEADGKSIPNPDKLHDHLSGMMEGKLGSLAKEIAEETVGDMKDLQDTESVNDVFQKMFRDPSKLMGLVSTVGDKIDKKIKSGDLKESELIEEASEMLKKMKDMPGMSQFESMFKQFGKVDLNAMQSKMNSKLNAVKTRERLQEKLKKRQAKDPEKKKK